MSKLKKSELGLGIKALLSGMDNSPKPQSIVPVPETANVVAETPSLSNIAAIPMEQIETNPLNPRTDFEPTALKELSESLKVHGLIQPVTVRRMANNEYQLISGERRFRAAKLAGLLEIPAYIRLADNDQELLEMALVENIQREDLNSIEVAISYQRLMDECGLSHEQMADRVGKQRSTITNYTRLLKLPPEVQTSIKSRQITMGHARALVGVSDVALQLMLFQQIVREGLSVRDVEALIAKYAEDKKATPAQKAGKPSLPEAYKRVQDDLSQFLGTKIQLKHKTGGKGQIVINFNSDNELNRILDTLETK
jgi:ParB family chromosome partitioning protein